MKIRLSVSKEKYDELREFLDAHGIEVGDDAELVLTDFRGYPAFLPVRDAKREKVSLAVEEVIYIEAFGKDIEVHAGREVFFAQDRMYQLEQLLDPAEFIRVSKSVIISRKHVKKIRPSLSMKFVLTMTDGTLVDVTRSYYNDFRKFFNI